MRNAQRPVPMGPVFSWLAVIVEISDRMSHHNFLATAFTQVSCARSGRLSYVG